MMRILPQGIAPVKQWGVLPWGLVLFLQHWDLGGGSGVLWWIPRALYPHTCTCRCHGIRPVLAGTSPVCINELGADSGPPPASRNMSGPDRHP